MHRSVAIYARLKLNQLTSHVSPPDSTAETRRRRVLVVHCHPDRASLSKALCDAVERGLRDPEAGREVRLRRLYCYDDPAESYGGKDFDAALSAEEWRNYHDLHAIEMRKSPRTIASAPGMTKAICEAVADLRWCDSIVLVYPTWWFNFPAMMKGYLDRVLLNGVAFALPGLEKPIITDVNAGDRDVVVQPEEPPIMGLIPKLTNVSKIGVVTTYGASSWLAFASGDAPRVFISRIMRPLCSRDCAVDFSALHGIDTASDADRKAFLRDVEERYRKF
jgi:putative NADPH-quinone reductase